MNVSVSSYIAKFLRARGIDTVFELSGGMIMQFLDTLYQENAFTIVNVYHEQAASFCADAMGRLSGKPGVAIGTSGPGALNLLTGIGSCYFDSSPAIFITGQVNRSEQKGPRPIRQLGFQETDIVSVAAPVTKWAVRINSPEEVLEILPRAYALACAGRPGPVLIDIPMDVFRAKIEVNEGNDKSPAPDPCRELAANEVQAVWTSLRKAQRPLVLVGNGVHAAGQAQALRAFVEREQLPVVSSLLAVDVMPYDHPLRVGLIGTYGNRWANLAIAACDLLLVIGSRLDIRQTGADTASLVRGREIIHVDVELAEMNNRVPGCMAVHAEVGHFLESVRHLPSTATPLGGRAEWLAHIAALRMQWPDVAELAAARGINPNTFMHALSHGRNPAAYCVDVGLHQMWAAQSLEIAAGSRFLTSGGMGAMGFALPAGVAVCFRCRREQPVVVIAGDGGFQLNIQELQTVAHHQLPLKIIVMNNHCHGMTRQFQDTYFGARYVGTVWGYSTPNFVAIAAAYGIESRLVAHSNEVSPALDWLWHDPLKPCLLQVEIDMHTNAYPKLAFGRPISEMEPHAKPIEMEGT